MHVKNLDVVFLHSVSNQRLSDAKFSDKVLTIFTAAPGTVFATRVRARLFC